MGNCMISHLTIHGGTKSAESQKSQIREKLMQIIHI